MRGIKLTKKVKRNQRMKNSLWIVPASSSASKRMPQNKCQVLKGSGQSLA